MYMLIMRNSNFNRQVTSYKLSHNAALYTHTFTLMTFLAASSAPTPLYRLYQQHFHFSPVLLTLIFATYTFALLLTLLVAGSLSDYIGRKPVIFVALILEIIVHGLFLVCIQYRNAVYRTRFARYCHGFSRIYIWSSFT